MSGSVMMSCAVDAFNRMAPDGCRTHRTDKPLYVHVKVEGWPYSVHYEFRQQDDALCIELHIEDKQYVYLGDTLRACAEHTPAIGGVPLVYLHKRIGRHRKVWPSLNLAIPPGSDSKIAAEIMLGFITATRESVTQALAAQCKLKTD